MFRTDRYGWVLTLALLLEPVAASSQAAINESGQSGEVAGNAVTDEPTAEDGKRSNHGRRKSRGRIPEHVALRLRAISRNLEALSERGNTATIDGLFSLALGGASIALGALVDDPSLPTYLYVFGSIQAVRGASLMILVPDPTEPALRFSVMPMASVSEVKRRLRFGSVSFKDLADGNRWARLVDGTLLVGAGLLAVPLLLIRDDFAFDTALDYFVVAGAGFSLLMGTATLLMPTEAERRYASYLETREEIKKRWQRERRKTVNASRVQASLYPTAGGAAVMVRFTY